jgi:hypothetical protein
MAKIIKPKLKDYLKKSGGEGVGSLIGGHTSTVTQIVRS